MADGVRIRIVGDDSEFIKTLERLEQRAAQVFRGANVQALQLDRLLSQTAAQLRQGFSGMSYSVAVNGNVDSLAGQLAIAADGLAGALNSRTGEVAVAAGKLAQAAKNAMGDTGGAYTAGVQLAAGFQKGISARQAAVAAAARALANAATGAMRTTLMIRSPSRVTMRMGEYAGEGFEIGLTRTLQTAVRNAGNVVGAINLSPQTAVARPATDPAAGTASGRSAQALYLNVDGHTLASVIGEDMRTTLNRRSRSIGMGLGR